MKKYYKVKEKNITKLKQYLDDGIKTNGKRSRRCSSSKYNSPKRNNV